MMRGYKELNKRGTSYLCGYTDALADLAYEIGMSNPDLHNCSTSMLLVFLNDYLGNLLKDQEGGAVNAAE